MYMGHHVIFSLKAYPSFLLYKYEISTCRCTLQSSGFEIAKATNPSFVFGIGGKLKIDIAC